MKAATRWRCRFAWACVLATLTGARAADQGAGKTGALFIVGGGKIGPALRQQFVDLAGGKAGRLVVVPTASEYADGPKAHEALDPWKKYGFAALDLMHTRSRAKADEPAFSAAIEKATAVWVGGGDQSRVIAAYKGTLVEQRLKGLLLRGGVIGGTSAGAAIMTQVMITGGREKATVGQGFDFLPGAVVDQHFLARKRQNRLLGVLADHPKLVGFGIDEGTALIARGTQLEAAGASVVTICFAARGSTLPAKTATLKPGAKADLNELMKAALDRAVQE